MCVHFLQNSNIFVISLSTMGFSGTPDIEVFQKIFYDNPLWIKSKIVSIFSRSNNKLIIFLRIEADS